nr:immunoglobulin heavy chain junction region [Macaca mulatta]MOX58678.1 immunoglobulin heavy chain junction region [Macaca mulatta]MOX58716.1 immunoglobulin heavy chain junction region [Macaca mulatta]MOX58722.1 immunoglobulin heavy chain junction region [Macaca mulatta]MOX58841.1 immunoglobulin heavy chain junction region [Macaca mulatta]
CASSGIEVVAYSIDYW